MGLLRAATLSDYPALASRMGLDVARQLRDVGLTPEMIAQPDRLIPVDAVVRLLERSAAQSRCASFGLRLSEMRHLSHFGIVGLLLAHQRTPREAMRMIMQYQSLLNQAVALHMEESGKTGVLRTEILTDVAMPVTQATELLVAAFVQLFRLIAGAQWKPRAVHFRHARPGSVDDHHRILRCTCLFDDEFNGMSFPTADLDLANPAADPTMAVYARRFIDTLHGNESGSPLADVRRLVYLLLPMGRASIEQVAQSLGRHPRSLQRDLDRAGTSFSALLNGVRRDLVVGYLANPRLDVGHVAGLLGYSRHGSFTRWFCGEFGVTPVGWRRGNRN